MTPLDLPTAANRPATAYELDTDYDGEESRYAIYLAGRAAARRRIAETSLDGIGLCLQTLRAEREIGDDSRVGIFDRLDRDWLVNPFARGDL